MAPRLSITPVLRMAGIDEVSHKMTYALRLLRCVRSLMAQSVTSLRRTSLVAIGGKADMQAKSGES
jgi:hypothetical protein